MKTRSLIAIGVIIIFTLIISMNSCTSVDSGHKGVEVSWGGKTNMEVIYPEGLQIGMHWIWDDLVQYDVREKTIVQKFEFNDKNNMLTGVELAIDYNLDPNRVNQLHVKINDYETKLIKTMKSSAKEVIPQYTASELNLTERTEAEDKISAILKNELPDFYIDFVRVQLTDVDIPQSVANLAEETAQQVERNKLALKKEAEQKALASAKIAEARGDSASKIINALSDAKAIELKQKALSTSPQYIEYVKWSGYSKTGKSPYGENNFFGVNSASIIKGLN